MKINPIKNLSEHKFFFYQRIKESVCRTHFCDFCIDPLDRGIKIPNMPEIIDLEILLIKLDCSWSIVGHNSFVSGENFFVDRSIEKEINLNRDIFVTDLDSPISFDNKEFLIDNDKPIKKIYLPDEEVGIALSVEPSNWGSFLVRIFPKAIKMQSFGLEKILINICHPRQMEMLEIFGIKENSVIKHNPKFRYSTKSSLVVATEPTTNLFVSPSSRDLFLSIGNRYRDLVDKKIYVSRRSGIGSAKPRRCVNEDDVESALASLGFEIIYPDLLSVLDQIKIFANAKIVVGCSGAGMFNCIFCLPNTIVVDIESQPNWLYGHLNLFSSLNLVHGIFWGKPIDGGQNHAPFFVEIKSLIELIKKVA